MASDHLAVLVDDANGPELDQIVAGRRERVVPGAGRSRPGLGLEVVRNDVRGRAVELDPTAAKQDHAIAEPGDGRHVVRDEEHRAAGAP